MTHFKHRTLVKKLTYILTLGSFLGSLSTHAMTFNISIKNDTDKDLGFIQERFKYSDITFKDEAFKEDFIIHKGQEPIFEIYASVRSFKNQGHLENSNLKKDGISLLFVDPGVDIDPETADVPKVGIIFDKHKKPGVPTFFPFADNNIPEGYQINIVPDARLDLYRILISKK